VRRRQSDTGASSVPLRLTRYDPGDWPDAECHPQCAFWDAVRDWHGTDPDSSWSIEGGGPNAPFHPERI